MNPRYYFLLVGISLCAPTLNAQVPLKWVAEKPVDIEKLRQTFSSEADTISQAQSLIGLKQFDEAQSILNNSSSTNRPFPSVFINSCPFSYSVLKPC